MLLKKKVLLMQHIINKQNRIINKYLARNETYKRLSRNHLLVLENIIQAGLKQIFCPVSIDYNYELAHLFSLQVTKSIKRIAYMEIS